MAQISIPLYQDSRIWGTYMSFGAPNNNYYSEDKIRVGMQSSTSIQYQGILFFMLDSIPRGSSIDSAALSMYSYSDSCYNASIEFFCDRVTGSWNPQTVTYSTKPVAEAANRAAATVSGYEVWHTWNVTAMIKSHFESGGSGMSFNIYQPASATGKGKCYYRSGTKAPYILVNYTPSGMRINAGGSWKTGQPFVNVNGVWKAGTAYVNAGGVWKKGL